MPAGERRSNDLGQVLGTIRCNQEHLGLVDQFGIGVVVQDFANRGTDACPARFACQDRPEVCCEQLGMGALSARLGALECDVPTEPRHEQHHTCGVHRCGLGNGRLPSAIARRYHYVIFES